MFARSEWFSVKRVEVGHLRPVTWQGYLYLGVWAAIGFAPLVYFAAQGQPPEAIIWTIVAGLGFIFDIGPVAYDHLPPWRGRKWLTGNRSQATDFSTDSDPNRQAATSPDIVFLGDVTRPRVRHGRYDFFVKG